MREKKDTRIFFALWPDDTVRSRLAGIAAGIALNRPARRVPTYNLHLTLHFIGNVYYEERDCLQQAAHGVHGNSFDLVIDNGGYFARPRVGWLGCSELPVALAELHESLGKALRDCNYRPEKRAYQPHVTFARKLAQVPAVPEFAPLTWSVGEFVLIESVAVDNGVQYRVIETYPLS